MTGIMDILASLGMGGQTQPDNVIPASNGVTPLSGLTVTAPGGGAANPVMPPMQSSGVQTQGPMNDPGLIQSIPQVPTNDSGALQGPQGAPFNYDNSTAAGAVNDALAGEPGSRGGMANSGIYGLLPPGLQHGTLRNVLGALGDAFLVGSGRQPVYEPRMENQQIGQAMAGADPNDPNSMYAAAQRVAATGSPGSVQDADQMIKNTNDLALHNWYRTNMINDRNNNIFARLGPMAQGAVSGSANKDDYAARYAVLDKRAKMIDPTADASSAFGIPLPEDWYKTPGYGMTSNQQAVDNARTAQRGQSQTNAEIAAGSRVNAAGISAGGGIRRAQIEASKPTSATIDQGIIEKMNKGQALSPGEQYYVQHSPTFNARGGGRGLAPGLTPGGGAGPQHAPQQFQNGVVYHDAHGNAARYQNGQWVPVGH
jgi:hypothetical protein